MASFVQWLVIVKGISNELLGTLHPMSADSLRNGIHHHHAGVVELPKVFPLEKVSLAVRVLEGSVDVGRDSTPH